MTERHRVRPMLAHDIDPVLHIQASVYPATLLEGSALFLNRLRISPGTCLVAEDRTGLLGYLVAYLWLADGHPALDMPLDGLRHTSLVALQPAVGYWERPGYQAVAAPAGLPGWSPSLCRSGRDTLRCLAPCESQASAEAAAS